MAIANLTNLSPPKHNLVGKTFDRLKVVEFAGRNPHSDSFWICKCSCGTIKTIREADLKRTDKGRVGSCGCLFRDAVRASNSTHGLTKVKGFIAWKSMIRRCEDETDEAYKNYGGRGIKVCERWKNSFEAFRHDMGECPKGLSLDRIDNDGNYCPENCRWATRKQQNRNTRVNRRIVFNGRSVILVELAEEHGIDPDRLRQRLDAGWPVEMALNK